MNKGAVWAIGMDSVGPEPLTGWLEDGKLPNLAKLMKEGAYGALDNAGLYRTENSWLNLLHGCDASASEEWGHLEYMAGEYSAKEYAGYSFTKLKPFYAQPGVRAMVFDIPLAGVVESMDGFQVFGWGAEANQSLQESSPRNLLPDLVEKYGSHPVYRPYEKEKKSEQDANLNYRIPSAYDAENMHTIKNHLVTAARQRTKIIIDLLQREHWPLGLMVYGESHTAGHLFWHSSQAHPLNTGKEDDYYLEVLQAIDEGIGEIVKSLPDSTQLFVFSPHGMQANTLDLTSMLFLPELLYRWNFGKAALADTPNSGPPPDPSSDFSRHWREEVWALRTPQGEDVLVSPFEQEKQGDPLDWQPGNWYRECWPDMKAFVLPGYSEGLIRVNVKGRDGPNGIDRDEYDRICAEICELVMGLKDSRTGEAMAKDVLRVRDFPEDEGKDKPPADLVVLWKEDKVTDVVEHPAHGRIGPAPFFRTGGHSTRGFLLAHAPGFEAGSRLEGAKVTDLTATLLSRTGQEIPDYIKGKPL